MGCCNWPWENGCSVDQNIFNTPNNLDLSALTNSILQEFPSTVTNCSEAMEMLGRRISNRLHSQVIVTYTSTVGYRMLTVVNNKEAVIDLTVSSNCTFPVTVSFTFGTHTGSAQFGSIDPLISWVVANVK